MNKNDLSFKKSFGFETWDKEKIKKAFVFSEDYRLFISSCKTEREVVTFVSQKLVKAGFSYLEGIGESKTDLKGVKKSVYSVNRGKSLIAGRFGKQLLKDGLNIILAHIDSPRIDLKTSPVYEAEKLAWFKTQYYGGIKKYQWPTIPLALHGAIVKESGEKVEICIGEKPSDPVFTITDLLPHLSKKQMEKKLEEAIEGEELNILIGSISEKGEKEEKELVKKGILSLLFDKYRITEEDLVSADLELVPAGIARDLGFDASLIGGYGQDDRVCAFTALEALLQTNEPQVPNIVVLVDKEETGSESNTGALSNFIIDFISEMLYLEQGKHDENLLRDCLSASRAISADVTVGLDPDYMMVFDPNNTARIGAGVVIEKYSGRGGKYATNEATAEYLAQIRRLFNQNEILWQTGGLGKVDIGGGGTIAMFLARYNMDVVDIGPAILSMHSPFEVASKIDIYACFEAYRAFFSVNNFVK